MESEEIVIPKDAAKIINNAKKDGKRKFMQSELLL